MIENSFFYLDCSFSIISIFEEKSDYFQFIYKFRNYQENHVRNARKRVWPTYKLVHKRNSDKLSLGGASQAKGVVAMVTINNDGM